MVRKNWLILIIIFFISVLYFNLSLKEKVAIVVSKASFPSWDLFEKKLEKITFKSRGQSFQFINCDTYTQALEKFISKESHITMLTIYEALIAYEKLKGDVVIVLLLDYTVGSDGIIVNENIIHPTDLIGKVIGTEFGTIAHYTLMEGLQRWQLKTNGFSLVFDSPSNLIEKFRKGDINALSTYDPFLFRLLNESDTNKVLFSSKEIPGKICDVVIAHKSFVKEYPDIIENLKKQWFDLVRSDLNYSILLNEDAYKNQVYIENIKNNIYLTGELENNVAFGDSLNPGYLYASLLKMSEFLKLHNIVSKSFILSNDILYYGNSSDK